MAVRDVSGTTRVVVVIGDPIEHTLSPAMHNAGFDALELDWVYIAAHVAPAGVGAAVEAIRALDLSGMNVTVPHKQAVMPFLDELAPDAEAGGAVNTIVNRDGRLIGDNTDVVGIVRAVEGSLGARPWPEHVVVLGAGGAARGVVHAMTTVDAVERVTILNRTAEKADAMADEFDGATRARLARAGHGWCRRQRDEPRPRLAGRHDSAARRVALPEGRHRVCRLELQPP